MSDKSQLKTGEQTVRMMFHLLVHAIATLSGTVLEWTLATVHIDGLATRASGSETAQANMKGGNKHTSSSSTMYKTGSKLGPGSSDGRVCKVMCLERQAATMTGQMCTAVVLADMLVALTYCPATIAVRSY
jgi:hypothetical protein